MFSAILMGKQPTDVFKKLIAEDPGLTNSELAGRFVDFFEKVNSEARQVIWYWQRPGGRKALSDNAVNDRLVCLLRDAGYVIQNGT